MMNAYDCVVVGGGPAGATAAALVAQAGFATLLVERERLPRPHVGESLMPETYGTLRRLGVLEQMKQGKFVKKLSVQFISANGRESQPFYFKEHDPGEGAETWQVERADFDKMLFDNAAAHGADCYDGACVSDVLFEGERAIGVRLEHGGGPLRDVHCRALVDATGQQALLANRLGLKTPDPSFRKAAIWAYYKNARRDSGDAAGATLILHTQHKKCWLWFVPLANEITSIGVVGDEDYLFTGRDRMCAVFEDELVQCPALIERLMSAELVSRFHVAKDFAYTVRRRAGDGWTLVGDAGGFLDPIYSSGVLFALKSGEMAADAIIEGLQKGDVSAAQLGQWTGAFEAGCHWMRKLVEAFYTPEFSFGQFIREHPEQRGRLIDLLFGRVFHPGAGEIFAALDPALERARQKSRELQGSSK